MAGSDYIIASPVGARIGQTGSVSVEWYCPTPQLFPKWRMRYRSRKRYGGDEWGSWGAWYEPTDPTAGNTIAYTGTTCYFVADIDPVTEAFSYTDNTATQFEVQLRNVTSDGGWFGNQQDGSPALPICYAKPSITDIALKRNALGYVLDVDSSWTNGWSELYDNRQRTLIFKVGEAAPIYRSGPSYFTMPEPGTGDSGYFVLDPSMFSQLPQNGQRYIVGDGIGGAMHLFTADGEGILVSPLQNEFEVTECDKLVATRASGEDGRLTLSLVGDGSAQYDVDWATISYADGTIPGDSADWNRTGSQTFYTPPLDVPLTVHTAGFGENDSFSDNDNQIAAVTSNGRIFINFGDDYADFVALAGTPNVSHSYSRSRSYFKALDESLPTVSSGEQGSHSMTVTCLLDTRGATSAHIDHDALRRLSRSDDCILRLPGGRRWKCAVDGVSWSEGADNTVTSCSINLTEVL